MNTRIAMPIAASILAVAFTLTPTLGVGAAVTSPKAAIKTFDPNGVHIGEVLASVSCLPHEPEVKSDVAAASAIAAGDADLDAGHCQKAVADYQKAVDANPKDTNALFHHVIAVYGIARSTGDAGLQIRMLETAYHDADLGVAAAPKNPVFLELRAESRTILIGPHMMHRAPITMARYEQSELKNSYDDLTAAIALAPTYGEAYASRWMNDNRRHDQEQANYDAAQAQKYDPKAFANMQTAQRMNDAHVAQNMRDLENSRRKAAAFMMGLGVASGAIEVIPAP